MYCDALANEMIRTVQSVIVLERAEPVVLSSDLWINPVGLLPVHSDKLFQGHKSF